VLPNLSVVPDCVIGLANTKRNGVKRKVLGKINVILTRLVDYWATAIFWDFLWVRYV